MLIFFIFVWPLPFLLGNPPFIKFLTKRKKKTQSKFNSSFFSRILFYWNSYSFLYFLYNKWIRKIVNSDLNVINNRMLSLFNHVSILFEEQKLSCINIFLLEPTFNENPPHINTWHLCRTPPPNFLDLHPIIYLTLKSIKLLLNLDQLKIRN